ncbi:MAG: DUF434 domain-containing protein [Deltaproteobacteria bacterium]|nr:DUF434 domain-containing protein [Deltaproteobacteria bacterium]
MGKGPDRRGESSLSDTEEERLRRVIVDFRFLLERGYPFDSALRFVGNHHQLPSQQRNIVARVLSRFDGITERRRHRVDLDGVAGHVLAIDGLNQLITIETALQGGPLIRGADGCIRDAELVGGKYKTSGRTMQALRLVYDLLAEHRPAEVVWVLDAPVSGSGNLAVLIRQVGSGQDWRVEVVASPDAVLAQMDDAVVVSSDAVVLDHCDAWMVLVDEVIDRNELHPVVLDFDERYQSDEVSSR